MYALQNDKTEDYIGSEMIHDYGIIRCRQPIYEGNGTFLQRGFQMHPTF